METKAQRCEVTSLKPHSKALQQSEALNPVRSRVSNPVAWTFLHTHTPPPPLTSSTLKAIYRCVLLSGTRQTRAQSLEFRLTHRKPLWTQPARLRQTFEPRPPGKQDHHSFTRSLSLGPYPTIPHPQAIPLTLNSSTYGTVVVSEEERIVSRRKPMSAKGWGE